MKRALHLFDQLRNVVQGKAWPEVSHITGLYPERLPRRGETSIRQAASQAFVDDLAEGPSGAVRFRLELGRNIIVQDEGGSHALMLEPRHHEVKGVELRW